MRFPKSPPSWIELARQIPKARQLELHAQRAYWVKNDARYLHWDEFRRKKMPAGFSAEECWFILKTIRSASYREIDLHDAKGQPFVFGMPWTLSAFLQQLDLGEGLAGAARALDDSQTEAKARSERATISTLVEEAITSSQLEGARTTHAVAKEMLRTARKPRDNSEQMVFNNYRAMQHLRKVAAQPLNLKRLLELHRIVTQDTLEKPDASGRLRLASEKIRVSDFTGEVDFHIPPDARKLPKLLKAFFAFANAGNPLASDHTANNADNANSAEDAAPDFIHPVLRAIILHFWLAYLHPFYDGNGRTARALFYWSMLRTGYPLFELISISQVILRAPTRYARAYLHTETDDNDLTYFILHQVGVIRAAIEERYKQREQKARELNAVGRFLDKYPELNARQQALLAHALREPGAAYEIYAHARSHGVTHQTARDDLFELVERGFLEASRSSRRYQFRPTKSLQSRLARLAKK
ncbi:hypothetical protein AXK11_01315 [Cephaloticoccus primus]|uniref:Fido domain-containing protein n=1 Tax=Cephaloticoccus primus TaxID=1548207 RepID=A0A139SUB1_9BACT|nr:Fic family protein [Cephaloticoccus primus]KXU38104.1 hypothetical protein AXK11_01315 [Cephaloticoccus primus]